jgi:hypothetical protein
MKSTKEPITFDELKEGKHKIRNSTYSLSSEDNTFDIFFNDSRLATIYFQGTVRIYPPGLNKTEACRKRLNLILEPLNRVVVPVNNLWWICHKVPNPQFTDPKLFNDIMVIDS